MRLVTCKNRAIQKYLETLSKYSILCILRLAQQRGLHFYQTRSNAVILHDTLSAEFIEEAICMKTKDQLYQRESVILGPRVVLKANSQSGSQDLLVQEARSSWESPQDAESYGETRSNTADYRIPGISISKVKLQDARRQNNVTKLVEMFETHQHEEQIIERHESKAGDQQVQRGITKITRGHQPHRDLRTLWEFCTISMSWLQCLSEIGIIHCSSLAEHNIGEKEVMLFDRIALERHDFSVARAERLQNAKHWLLRLNADGPQKLLRQRPEFAAASKQCLKMQDVRLAQTRQSLRQIRPQHQQRQREDPQFEGGEHCAYYVDRKNGWRYCREPRGTPPAASQWQTSQWQTSWSSWQPTSSEKWWWFPFLGRNFRKSTGRCRQDTHSEDTSV